MVALVMIHVFTCPSMNCGQIWYARPHVPAPPRIASRSACDGSRPRTLSRYVMQLHIQKVCVHLIIFKLVGSAHVRKNARCIAEVCLRISAIGIHYIGCCNQLAQVCKLKGSSG